MSNWGEYEEENSNDKIICQEDAKEKSLINEAIKLIFLRKYNNINLKENELLKIFEECNYEDNCIIEKINNYLINNLIIQIKKNFTQKKIIIIILDLKIIQKNIINNINSKKIKFAKKEK